MRYLLGRRGMSEDEAERELERLERDCGPLDDMTSSEAGRLLNLRFREQRAWEIKTMEAVDRFDSTVVKEYAAECREADRKRKKEERAKQRAVKNNKPRERDLLMVLERGLGRPRKAADLIEEAKRLPSFKKANGRSISPEARAQGVHRALDELQIRGQIESWFETNERGREVRLARAL